MGTEESTNVGEAIFFRRHGAAVRMGKDFLGNLSWSFVGVAGFAQLDEVGVFSESASVNVERNAMLFADLLHIADVGKRNGLTASRIICNREHHQRDLPGTFALNDFLQVWHIHIPLEGMKVCGFLGFRDGQVQSCRACKLTIGTSGVKVGVIGNNVTLFAYYVK